MTVMTVPANGKQYKQSQAADGKMPTALGGNGAVCNIPINQEN